MIRSVKHFLCKMFDSYLLKIENLKLKIRWYGFSNNGDNKHIKRPKVHGFIFDFGGLGVGLEGVGALDGGQKQPEKLVYRHFGDKYLWHIGNGLSFLFY